MAKTAYESVDEYIASRPEAQQPVLRRLRAIIRKALPRATEGISYQIPVYKVNGAMVIYFAGWAKHFSLYPVGDEVPVVLRKQLEPYVMSKGTIRFPLSEAIPTALITKIAKLRAKEVAASRKPAERRKTAKR